MPRPFRLTAPETPEDAVHVSVAEAMATFVLPPATWWAYHAGWLDLTGAQAAKCARFGLRAGLPDFTVLHGVPYGIELKRRGAPLSQTRMVRTKKGVLRMVRGQREVFPELLAAGYREIIICESLYQVLGNLVRWGIPLRAKFSPVQSPRDWQQERTA